jgi:hypothetical protein
MTKRARMEDLGLSSNKQQINYAGDAGIAQRQPTKKLVIKTFKGINNNPNSPFSHAAIMKQNLFIVQTFLPIA